MASLPYRSKGCGGGRRVGARECRAGSPARPILQSGGERFLAVHKSLDVAAAAVLTVHVAEDGWCRGCRDQWQRLVPYPCTQAEWAAHIHEAGIRTGPEAGR
jgi:hypothetical protein